MHCSPYWHSRSIKKISQEDPIGVHFLSYSVFQVRGGIHRVVKVVGVVCCPSRIPKPQKFEPFQPPFPTPLLLCHTSCLAL